MPGWVTQGFDEYARRMPQEIKLKLVEITPGRRGKNINKEIAIKQEEKKILDALPKGVLIIALDVKGQQWDTPQLAVEVEAWLQGGKDVVLLVGGPDGLSEACVRHSDYSWSLSGMTLPHALVRVIIAEQLYRAWTILNHHPYHR